MGSEKRYVPSHHCVSSPFRVQKISPAYYYTICLLLSRKKNLILHVLYNKDKTEIWPRRFTTPINNDNNRQSLLLYIFTPFNLLF